MSLQRMHRHACLCIQTHAWMWMCTFTCVCGLISICVWVHVCLCVHIHVDGCVCMCMLHVCVCIHHKKQMSFRLTNGTGLRSCGWRGRESRWGTYSETWCADYLPGITGLSTNHKLAVLKNITMSFICTGFSYTNSMYLQGTYQLSSFAQIQRVKNLTPVPLIY